MQVKGTGFSRAAEWQRERVSAYRLLLIAYRYCLLPIAYCRFAYRLLLIAYCSSPIAYCRLIPSLLQQHIRAQPKIKNPRQDIFHVGEFRAFHDVSAGTRVIGIANRVRIVAAA